MTMMTRVLNRAIVLIMAAVTLTSCFKDEVQGTLFNIQVYSKNVSKDDPTKTLTELRAYAFNIEKNSNWTIESWEDALDGRIVNTDNGKVLTEIDVLGTWDQSAEYQLSLDLKAETVFMVVVDIENKIYATRRYDTPINWPVTNTILHIYACNKSGKATNWDMVNPFPDLERESLIGGNDEDDSDQSNEENE